MAGQDSLGWVTHHRGPVQHRPQSHVYPRTSRVALSLPGRWGCVSAQCRPQRGSAWQPITECNPVLLCPPPCARPSCRSCLSTLREPALSSNHGDAYGSGVRPRVDLQRKRQAALWKSKLFLLAIVPFLFFAHAAESRRRCRAHAGCAGAGLLTQRNPGGAQPLSRHSPPAWGQLPGLCR